MKRTHPQAGFSMLELGIVLVVIGLIIGGVFVGRGMVRDAQIRNAMGDVSSYTQAVSNFRDKYHALPGNFSGAEALWGTDPGGCPAAPNTVKKSKTCNGSGNGFIQSSTEIFRAWQHLAASGLLDTAAFTGVTGPASATNAVAGLNVPATSLTNGGFTLQYVSVATLPDGAYLSLIHNHAFILGAATADAYTTGPLLTPTEALSMDMKIDDGVPGAGTVQATNSNNCVNLAATATYNTAYGNPACSLVFITNF